MILHIANLRWVTSPRAHVLTPFPYLGNDRTDCAEIRCLVRGPIAKYRSRVKGGTYMHVHMYLRTPFLHLENGWSHCTEIWYLLWILPVMRSYRSWMRSMRTAHVNDPFPYLAVAFSGSQENRWMHDAESWCVTRDHLRHLSTCLYDFSTIHIPHNLHHQLVDVSTIIHPLVMHVMHATSGTQRHPSPCCPLFHISVAAGRIVLKCGVVLNPLAVHFKEVMDRGHL